MKLEEIEKYLPKYLSADSQKKLFEELKSFPDNITGEVIYTNKLVRENIVFQGDGIRGLLCINLPNLAIKPDPAVIMSNTCDIDTSNKRLSSPRILYTPLFLLNKYKNSLFKFHVETGKKDAVTIENHISDIRKQFVTHVF